MFPVLVRDKHLERADYLRQGNGFVFLPFLSTFFVVDHDDEVFIFALVVYASLECIATCHFLRGLGMDIETMGMCFYWVVWFCGDISRCNAKEIRRRGCVIFDLTVIECWFWWILEAVLLVGTGEAGKLYMGVCSAMTYLRSAFRETRPRKGNKQGKYSQASICYSGSRKPCLKPTLSSYGHGADCMKCFA